jgi:hypothetical protein
VISPTKKGAILISPTKKMAITISPTKGITKKHSNNNNITQSIVQLFQYAANGNISTLQAYMQLRLYKCVELESMYVVIELLMWIL